MNRSATTVGEPAGPGGLPGLLRAHTAGGRLSQTAAVNLLISHRYWLTHPGFTDRYVHLITTGDGHRAGARIDWDAALAALDRGHLAGTGTQTDLLRIAASLAAGTPISLRRVLGGLDHATITAVATAITTANGAHPEQDTP